MALNRPRQYTESLSFKKNKNPKRWGLYSNILSQMRFDRLMFCRYCSLYLSSHGYSHGVKFCISKSLQNSEIMLGDRKFSSEKSILIFYLLIRLVEGADMQRISKGQLMALLPFLIAVSDVISIKQQQTDLVPLIKVYSAWPEDLQHLFHTYATNQSMNPKGFNHIPQAHNENKMT